MLDLQFGHSQRVGYDVATNVLSQLQRIGNLHKRRPEHASLECCARRISRRSSWKRALSVTTAKSGCWGAMITEEQIAEAIYNGLRNYFMQHPLQSAPSRRGGADRQRRGAGRDVD